MSINQALSRGRRVAIILAVLCLTPLAWAGTSFYLAGVGPPVLRFDSPVRRGTVYPTEFSYDESKPKIPANAGVPVLPATTEADDQDNMVMLPNPAATNNTPSLAEFPIPSADMSNTQPSIADFAIVTPQMILNFLKPIGVGDGKGAAVLVPVKIGFTPPISAGSGRNSSTAVYKRE